MMPKKNQGSSEGETSSAQLAATLLDVVPAMMKVIRKTLRTAAIGDLTIPQLRILAHVHRDLNTAAQLAELQGVSVPAISKMLDLLVARKLILRSYKEGNRKQIFLSLTDQGSALYLKARKITEKNFSQKLEKLSERKRSEMKRGLAALRALYEME